MSLSKKLVPAGTGERAGQLDLFGDFAGFYEKKRAWECEARVQAAGPYKGARLLKALPPYIKWPIWRAQPKRCKDIPCSFRQLGIEDMANEGSVKQVSSVIKRTFNLTTLPRVVAEVTYLNGELGPQDRRVLCALSQHAVDNLSHENGYSIRAKVLADLVGLSLKNSKNYQDLPRCLWRLSRTLVHLNRRDELAQSWGTEGFLLLPHLEVCKAGREWEINYDFPEPAKRLLRNNALCTVDIHRLRALNSPPAESLYCLLYDVAQWSHLTCITYSIPDLTERLGLTMRHASNGRRTYRDWSKPLHIIRVAAERTYMHGQIIIDYKQEGRGTSSSITFFFAKGPCRTGHLPPSKA